jgi:apolipoprotein D and lipocalin family protein
MFKAKLISALQVMVMAATFVQAGSSDKQPLRVVPSINLSRYTGRWYEVARLPNRFQKKCAGDVSATYTVMDDGQLKVVNQCSRANGETASVEGRARLANKRGPNTKLKVRFAPAFLSFLPFVWGDYWIIELAPDYSYAVVGEPTRKYLWILSRTPQLDDGVLQQLLEHAAAQGYDVGPLIRTKHSAG